MIFAFPYALIGAVTIAGLVAIYTFRARARRKPVSSLMLWQQARRPLQGGIRRDRLRLPPLFYLELAVLALLLLAALSPYLRRPERGTLTVVYDTSASMTARDHLGATPQHRAIHELRAFAGSGSYGAVRLLLARADGPHNGGALAPRQAIIRLEETPCRDIADTLDATLARAAELAGADDDILILTDRPPPAPETLRPGLHWRACGQPLRNTAITLAERTWDGGGRETLAVTVTVYDTATNNAALPLRITNRDDNSAIFNDTLTLSGNSATLRLDLPPATPAIEIAIPPDALDHDNRAILLPDAPLPLPVAIAIADAALARVVQRALDATGRAFTDAGPPKLIFSDTVPAGNADPTIWRCILTPPVAPRLIRGPYLAERTDPLLEGVSFDGLVWNAGTNALPGRTLLYGGNAQLITFQRQRRAAPVCHIISSGAADALFRSPAWPALVCNLVQLCADAQPGAPSPNLRVGMPVRLNTAPGATKIKLTTPDGPLTLYVGNNSKAAGNFSPTPAAPRTHGVDNATPSRNDHQAADVKKPEGGLPVRERTQTGRLLPPSERERAHIAEKEKRQLPQLYDTSVLWTPETAGLHRLSGSDGKTTTLAVNFRAPAESDLTRCASGAWQAPHTTERLRRTHRPYAWAAALAALLLLILHHFLLRR